MRDHRHNSRIGAKQRAKSALSGDRATRPKGPYTRVRVVEFVREKGPGGRIVTSVVIRGSAHRKLEGGRSAAAPEQGPPAVAEAAFALAPRAKAILKGIEIAQSDLRESGGAFDQEEVTRLLQGISAEELEREVREGGLLAVRGPQGELRFPAIQFNDDGAVIDGLGAVQRALPTKNGFAVLSFLTNRDARIENRRPIDLLKSGEIGLATDLARRYGEQGA
jgi:hypothetical protein